MLFVSFVLFVAFVFDHCMPTAQVEGFLTAARNDSSQTGSWGNDRERPHGMIPRPDLLGSGDGRSFKVSLLFLPVGLLITVG